MSLTLVEGREFERVYKRRLGRSAPADVVADSQSRRRNRIAAGRSLNDLVLEDLLAELLPMAGGASSFNVVLDTTAPAGVTFSINGGASYTTSQTVTLTIATSDSPTTGYQMAIWGDVDVADNANIQTNAPGGSAPASSWFSYGTSQSVKLSSGDASKTLNLRIRDDVWNESSTVTHSITLDTTLPVASIVSGPDATKISQVAGKRTVTFGWQSDSAYQAYEIAVVANSGSARGSGTVIGTTNGSTNVSGGSGPATTTVTTTIDGRDLGAASSGDGTKVVKVFVQDSAGNWSA
jgi:hypothetical protein